MEDDVKFRFYNLAWNPEFKRADEIVDAMNKKLAEDPEQTNGEWFDWCIENIAEDEAERFFIAFTAGTRQGYQVAMEQQKEN